MPRSARMTSASVASESGDHSLALASQRDSISQHVISVGAGMWLDEAVPSAAATSLEDSLHLLHTHGPTHGALSFDDDHDVHAMFPMLSESSFDYDDEKESLMMTPTTTPIDAAFPSDLSPILAAMPTPRTTNTTAFTTTPSQPKRAQLIQVNSIPVVGPSPLPISKTAPLSSPAQSNRKRRRHDAGLLAQWNKQELSTVFSIFKSKWPNNDAAMDAATTEYITMLRQRCATISGKLATTNRSTNDVQQLYHDVLQSIIDLLALVMPHDINLLNPDEIRVALWCWYKLHRDGTEIPSTVSGDDEQCTHVAKDLKRSIVRSRRQMLKAKSNKSVVTGESLVPMVESPPLFDDNAVEEMDSLEGILREALEHSSLPSYLFQLAPQPVLDAGAEPVVHHPLVRKKAKQAAGSNGATTATGTSKRKRSESIELYHAFTSGTPLSALSTASGGGEQSQEFVTPPVGTRPKKPKTAIDHTPSSATRKKIHIKLRMVPRDTQTKQLLERCNLNPKVELKLSSTKKVTDVLVHMAAKWTNVKALVDEHATLHFYQKESTASSPDTPSPSGHSKSNATSSSWSRQSRDVTCLDIWKQCGKIKGDEYIAVVSYQWRVDDDSSPTKRTSPGHLATPTVAAPLLDLLDGSADDVKKQIPFDDAFTSSSHENSPVSSPHESEPARVQPLRANTAKQSLLAFSETVAFDPSVSVVDDDHKELSLASLPDDALNELMDCSPNSQRLRRRITPVLVQTNECQI